MGAKNLAACNRRPRFLYILGPTATGKSDFAHSLARELNIPIINCDSVQVYKYLDIGTAKPSQEDRKQVPHYLYDYVEPPQTLTAADYIKDVAELFKKNNFPRALFVGGSGFYVQALEKGLYPNAKASPVMKQEIEAWIKDEGYQRLYLWIKSRDPEFAAKISGNDHYRIRRAVEVMKTQNKTMTELKKQLKQEDHSVLPRHDTLKIAFFDSRDHLRERVQKRTEKMLENGFVEEVKSLLSRNLGEWGPMLSVGYKEVQNYILKNETQEQLIGNIVTRTMQLAKKQMTWFKRDSGIQWYRPDQLSEAKQKVLPWLGPLDEK